MVEECFVRPYGLVLTRTIEKRKTSKMVTMLHLCQEDTPTLERLHWWQNYLKWSKNSADVLERIQRFWCSRI
jgi:uncharacterized protein YigA (DUF484 family)